MPAAGSRRLRAGVVGAGVIAQVMHLHYLTELSDLFQVTAICDLVPENAQACASRYGIAGVFSDWRELVASQVDAVLVLTSGSHAPIAIAAAEAGKHVFTEKPMSFSVAEGKAMVIAAAEAGVTLMVGYPKRYDLAYARFAQEAAQLDDARLLRVTTMESPSRPYLAHYSLPQPARPGEEVAARLLAASDAGVTSAIGPATSLERRVYADVLLDTLVHEINMVRGLLGEPDTLDYVDLSEQYVAVMLRFGKLRAAIHWVALPGIARYQMEFAMYAPDRRVTLSFPSPFLRNEPASVVTEGGDLGTVRSWRNAEVIGYESGFRRELEAFHSCAMTGAVPATSGYDGLADIALCEAIIACHRLGKPIPSPTAIAQN
ncbi:MAG TPA: Gfo/Idh/MocA family oxidoreductase [Streptosporangiaceae bacterium]|nr:Gfo/Idh/MocA family oxidoreductase [Streptosporangiaceae bacterium]